MDKKVLKVLVFPGGTEIGLEIHRSLCQCKEVVLHSAGLDVSNHAPYVFARHFNLPSIHDPMWVECLNNILIENGIDYVFPAYDDVIVALAQNAERIKARIVSSPLETCLITRSKSSTYSLFVDTLPVPRLYDDARSIDHFPVFMKPDKGQGSQRTHIVHSKDHLSRLLKEDRDYLVLEYLPGEECTVDCFTDRDKGLLFCSGRQRIRVRSGISMNTHPVDNKVFCEYATAISKKLTFHGAWFFQLKKNQQGVYSLLEIAPRIAGSMAVHRVKGVNFALLSLYEQERVPVEIMPNEIDVQLDRALVNRYKHKANYSTVYVDLDDLLILNGNVNVKLVSFLYQCVNKGIRIVLLTKHAEDLDRTLRKYRLSGVFDEIVHMTMSDRKYRYIKEDDAILVDDSFSERKEASDKLGILTFDCSMIEILLDERG